MADHDFAGRRALITGAASGIGAACARWLAQRGIAGLVLVDLDAAGLDALDLPCPVERHAGDVADEALWDRIEASSGPLHHAVINAGIANGTPIVAQDFGEWRKILSVNLDGAFLALRMALRNMKQHGTGKSVVLTSSAVGVKPYAFTSAYGSSKAAVAHLARVAAAEHQADLIRVNAIAPGRVETPIWTKTDQYRLLVSELGGEAAAMAALREEAEKSGPIVTADHLAGQIGFLLSDAAANITGTVLVSDGGFTN